MTGVIIKVYIESSKLFSQQRNQAKKKIHTIPSSSRPPTSSRTRGYDRRAELLAYAQKLRSSNAQQFEHWPSSKSKPNLKKWRWSLSFPKIRPLIFRSSRQWKYERIVTEDYNNIEGFCSKKKIKMRNTEPNKTRESHIYDKLKCFIKELSCGC